MLAIAKTTVRSLVDELRTRIVYLGNSKDKLNQWEAIWCKRISKTGRFQRKARERRDWCPYT